MIEHPFRKWRRAAKLKLREVAPMLDASEPKVSRIETGKQEPDLNFVRKAIAMSGGEVTAADFVRYQPQQAAE